MMKQLLKQIYNERRSNAFLCTVFEKESFELLENILEEAGELSARVPYEDLVTTQFSEQAAK